MFEKSQSIYVFILDLQCDKIVSKKNLKQPKDFSFVENNDEPYVKSRENKVKEKRGMLN